MGHRVASTSAASPGYRRATSDPGQPLAGALDVTHFDRVEGASQPQRGPSFGRIRPNLRPRKLNHSLLLAVVVAAIASTQDPATLGSTAAVDRCGSPRRSGHGIMSYLHARDIDSMLYAACRRAAIDRVIGSVIINAGARVRLSVFHDLWLLAVTLQPSRQIQ